MLKGCAPWLAVVVSVVNILSAAPKAPWRFLASATIGPVLCML